MAGQMYDAKVYQLRNSSKTLLRLAINQARLSGFIILPNELSYSDWKHFCKKKLRLILRSGVKNLSDVLVSFFVF